MCVRVHEIRVRRDDVRTDGLQSAGVLTVNRHPRGHGESLHCGGSIHRGRRGGVPIAHDLDFEPAI